MTWIHFLWPMVTGACVAMGVIHLRIGLRRKPGTAHLLFSLNAFVVAAYSYFEHALTRADSPARYLALLRGLDIMAAAQVVTVATFVWVFFRTGRKWLAVLAIGLACVGVIPDLLPEPKLVFLQMTGIRKVETFGGATFMVADGVRNPWNAVFYLGVLALLVFVVDASVRLWRGGSRRRAFVVGGTISFFVLFGGVSAALVDSGLLRTPYLLSFCYLAIIAAMGSELSDDALRAAQLSDELRESEARMALAVEGANFGIWIRDLRNDTLWATPQWRELFGFTPTETLTTQHFLDRLHPEDRGAVDRAITGAAESGGVYENEYRLLLPDGRVRWIASRGHVEFDAAGRPVQTRGASRDCTARKLAEQTAHDLGGRLIHAQEEAQRRLASELHDDLSQSLALLSVELEMFGQNPPAEAPQIAARMEEFSTHAKALSSEVHRLSHELHPAKLEQLGLVAALRGFCREFALAHGMAIEFTEHDVPREVPRDAALCLYRIAQEALHNAVKHSGGTLAKVTLARDDGHLRIVIADDGTGFDPQAAHTTGSLGLVSMQERVRFVGGRLAIASRPGEGTRVEVRVPVAASPVRPPA